MTIYCEGKHGTHLRVTGNNTDKEIISGGGVVSIQSQSATEGLARWRVYTGTTINGRFYEGYRGIHAKLNSQFFFVYKSSSRRNHLTRSDIPNSSINSWVHSSTSSISRLVFVSGTPPTTTYKTVIRDSLGTTLFEGSQTSGYHTVSLIECGCDISDTQCGSFPSNYCCTNCEHQSGILDGILSALQGAMN